MSSLLLPVLVLGAIALMVQRLWPAWGQGEPRSGPSCAHCGGTLWRRRRCAACGLDGRSAAAGELADLAASERQLDRFLHRSCIADSTYRQLLDTIAAERAKLLQSIPAACPPPASTSLPAEDYPIAVARRRSRARAIISGMGAGILGLAAALGAITTLEPALALGVSLVLGVLFTSLAIRRDRRALHFVGMPGFILGLLALVHQERGIASLPTPRSGWAFFFTCCAAGVFAELLYRKQFARHARVYAAACLALAAASIAWVTLPAAGLQGPARAALITAGCAAAVLLLNVRWRHARLNALCCALLTCATLWAGWWLLPQQPEAWGTLLALLAVALAAAGLRRTPMPEQSEFAEARSLSLSASFLASSQAVAAVALAATGAAIWSGPGWSFAYAFTAAVFTLLLLMFGVGARSTIQIRAAGASALLFAVTLSGCIASRLADLPFAPPQAGLMGLGSALAGLLLAGVAVRARRTEAILTAWREAAGLATATAAALALLSAQTQASALPSYVGLVVVMSLLSLGRLYGATTPTYLASVAGWLTLVHGTRALRAEPGAPLTWLASASCFHALVTLAVAGFASRANYAGQPAAAGEAPCAVPLRRTACVSAALAFLAVLWVQPTGLASTITCAGLFVLGALFWNGRTLLDRLLQASKLPSINSTWLAFLTIGPLVVLTAAQARSLATATLLPPGWIMALAVPYVLVAGSLVVQAWRTGSDSPLFGAGLAVAYAVAVIQAVSAAASGIAGAALFVQATECAAVAAALWSVAWLGARTAPANCALWFHRQVTLIVAGNALLFGGAILFVLAGPRFAALSWVREVDTPLGALVLASLVAVIALGRARGRIAITGNVCGWVALAALTLLAATTYRTDPGLAVYTVAVGAAVVALGCALCQRGTLCTSDAARREAGRWLMGSGVLAVLFTGRVTLFGNSPAIAAVPMLILSGAGLVASAGANGPAWTFASGLSLVAASLLATWHVRVNQPFAEWWVQSAQIGAITASLFSLAWQRVAGRPHTGTASPLPGLMSWLGLGVTTSLLVVAVAFVAAPGHAMPAAVSPAGQALGWAAFGVSLAAARRQLQWRGHLVGGLVAGMGVLAACGCASRAPGNPAALVVLLGTWTVAAGTSLVRSIWAENTRTGPDAAEGTTRGWVAGACVAVGSLALLAAVQSPGDRAWATTFVVAVAAIVTAQSWRTCKLGYTAAAAASVNIIGSLLWSMSSEPSLESFLFAQAFCLAVASAAGAILQRAAGSREPVTSHLAFVSRLAADGAALLVVGVGFITFGTSYLSPEAAALPRPPASAWPAVIATAAALSLRLHFGVSTNLALGYAVGWSAFTLALRSLSPDSGDAAWVAPLLAAVSCAASSVVAACVDRARLRESGKLTCFANAQLAAGVIVAMASVGVALNDSGLWPRLTGPLSLVLLAYALRSLHPRVPVSLGVLALCEGAWALGGSASPVWLWRSAQTVLALAVAVVACTRGRRTAPSPAWRGVFKHGENVAAWLTAATSVVTAWIWLSEQALTFDRHPQLWLVPPAALVLGLAFVQRARLGRQQRELIGGLTCFAVCAASAAELFKAGPGQSAALALGLGMLAAAGIVGGVYGRLRGVALQGTAFLAVATVAALYHFAVARGHGWLLWLAGIMTGLAVAARKRLPTSRHLFRRGRT